MAEAMAEGMEEDAEVVVAVEGETFLKIHSYNFSASIKQESSIYRPTP